MHVGDLQGHFGQTVRPNTQPLMYEWVSWGELCPPQGEGRAGPWLAPMHGKKGVDDTYTSNEFMQLSRPLTACVYIQIHT